MSYCNLTTDLKTRGRYVNDDIPSTVFSTDVLTAYQYEIEDYIHARLYQAGITTLPIVEATHPYVFRRLKYLSALGINAKMEETMETRGKPSGGGVESLSARFVANFNTQLDMYCDNPAYTLFQGESDTSIIGGRAKVRPIGNVVYGETYELINDGDYTVPFDIDTQF